MAHKKLNNLYRNHLFKCKFVVFKNNFSLDLGLKPRVVCKKCMFV